jgi:hypothetical protein
MTGRSNTCSWVDPSQQFLVHPKDAWMKSSFHWSLIYNKYKPVT